MQGWQRILWASLLSLGLLAACADWQVKTPSEEPVAPQEQKSSQGKTSIGGEVGKQGRGTDR